MAYDTLTVQGAKLGTVHQVYVYERGTYKVLFTFEVATVEEAADIMSRLYLYPSTVISRREVVHGERFLRIGDDAVAAATGAVNCS